MKQNLNFMDGAPAQASTKFLRIVLAGACLHRGLKKIIPSRLRAVSGSIFRREKVFVFEKALADVCFKIEAKVEIGVRVVQHDDFLGIAKRLEKFKIKDVDMTDFVPSITIIKERLERGQICIIADIHGDLVHACIL